jgi:uncharacterized protein YodC (DUF2158 family)
MTVVSLGCGPDRALVECRWFNDEMKTNSAQFPEAALVGDNGSLDAASVANRLSGLSGA